MAKAWRPGKPTDPQLRALRLVATLVFVVWLRIAILGSRCVRPTVRGPSFGTRPNCRPVRSRGRAVGSRPPHVTVNTAPASAIINTLPKNDLDFRAKSALGQGHRSAPTFLVCSPTTALSVSFDGIDGHCPSVCRAREIETIRRELV